MITREKLENHIKALQEKHDILDKEIWELDCYYDESVECNKLKKKKLKLKDEIEQCTNKLKVL
jgi:uncharacterized protein YdcH (DUF465 family)